MSNPQSKITSQGQITVPAEIRRTLGVGPGSVLEWQDEGGKVIVKRAGKYTVDDIRRAFAHLRPSKPVTVEEMDEGIAEFLRQKHARR